MYAAAKEHGAPRSVVAVVVNKKLEEVDVATAFCKEKGCHRFEAWQASEALKGIQDVTGRLLK